METIKPYNSGDGDCDLYFRSIAQGIKNMTTP